MAPTNDSPAWPDSPELVAFYTGHRCRPEHLYPSERRFLPWLAAQARSVLDTGCAAGGFSDIWRHFAPDIDYTGIDISGPLVEAARQLHPGLRFLKANATEGIELPDGYADVVAALGWLHWERGWVKALGELWRLSGRFLFFDCRIAPAPESATVATQRLELTGASDGNATVPYVVVAWPELAATILDLRPRHVLGFGYRGRPAESVVGVEGEVVFGAFVIERGTAERPTVCLDLPLAWPEHVGTAELLAPGALGRLVPEMW